MRPIPIALASILLLAASESVRELKANPPQPTATAESQGFASPAEAWEAQVKAGKAVTLITQKAVEILGPLGYSRDWLVEKWMRDAKINDLFEGTGQINLLIVARRILGYTRRELK